MRARIVLAALLLAMGPASAVSTSQAQAIPGSICISTFADANANGVQEPEETALAGVNVNLSTGGAIIATHITSQGAYCFENLLQGVYTVSFTDSLLYQTTTAREGTFTLEGGQRLTIDPFGAAPVSLAAVRAEAEAAREDEPLEIPTRLMLSTGGSMVVMLAMVAIGVVMLVLMTRRRPKKQSRKNTMPPPPTFIPPPPMRPEDWQRQTGEHRQVGLDAIYADKSRKSRP